MQKSILENNLLNISSRLVTLRTLVIDNYLFNIPIYQRLYVWQDAQINTLLEDLWNAFDHDDPYFYLGGVMLIKNHEGSYDLIDGQQRFTTLWLLSYVLQHDLSSFVYQNKNKEKKKRISFSIRDFANNYFDDPSTIQYFSTEALKEIAPIAKAARTIERFFCTDKFVEERKAAFALYVYNKVWLVASELPEYIDENKLFEVLNNRGVQLQQHEILKARLLKEVPDFERTKYAQIWEACSLMDNYLEKNIKDVSGLAWKALLANTNNYEEAVGLSNNIFDVLSVSNDEIEKARLLYILEIPATQYKEEQTKSADVTYDSGKVRSIISFPMLLLHVLRIFLYKKQSHREEIPAVNEKRLLHTFDQYFQKHLNETDVKEFIVLLWKVRERFDKYLIKWVTKDNVEVHAIKKLYLNKDALQRRDPDTNEGFALLQSMLYHSQEITTHYWLTPFLGYLLETDNVEEAYRYLRQLDNVMFCARNEELSLRSWKLINANLNEENFDISLLDESRGTKYHSYWFYKLEFILWYLLKDKKEGWKDYRMTAKNSVEHISPQNPKQYDENKVWDEGDSEEIKRTKLNDFGNLVLLSSSMNSAYSNKTFKVKQIEFKEKKRLDSLKSALIFENQSWNYSSCKKHKDEMKKYFEQYFCATK